jgi:hypothetical protein
MSGLLSQPDVRKYSALASNHTSRVAISLIRLLTFIHLPFSLLWRHTLTLI